MDDDIIEHIILCAHYHTINNLNNICHETMWPNQTKWISELFPPLLELILKYCPPPPPPPPASATPTMPQDGNTPTDQKCGACGEFSHISKCFISFVVLKILKVIFRE